MWQYMPRYSVSLKIRRATKNGRIVMGCTPCRNLFQYLSSAPYLQNFNWLQTRVRKLPNRVYFLHSLRRRGMARDPIVLLSFLLSLPLSVFSLKLHPPRKYHCSNIQNGDVHCGTLEWAQCGSCVAARACCDLQLIRDFFKICGTPKIKSGGWERIREQVRACVYVCMCATFDTV